MELMDYGKAVEELEEYLARIKMVVNDDTANGFRKAIDKLKLDYGIGLTKAAVVDAEVK